MTDMSQTAEQIVREAMEAVGLGTLGDWAWVQYTQNGVSIQDLPILARSTPEYKARYPAMEELNRQGHSMTEGQYQQYEQTVQQMARAYGLPKGMYDTPQDIANLLVKNVSASEASDRIKLAASAAFTAPVEVRQALAEAYGVSPGNLIGYYLDPDKAMPLIEKEYQAAQILGAGKMSGVSLSRQKAETLADRGVSFDQAQQGLAQVALQDSLRSGPGENVTGEELVDAQFGNAKARTKVQRVVDNRQAQFAGGGGAVSTQGGVSGLGSASAG